MRKVSVAVTAICAVVAAAAAIITGYATYRLSNSHMELDALDPIKRGFEGIGTGTHDVVVKCTDNTIVSASEIVSIQYGGVYLRSGKSLLVIRYSSIASFAVDDEVYR